MHVICFGNVSICCMACDTQTYALRTSQLTHNCEQLLLTLPLFASLLASCELLFIPARFLASHASCISFTFPHPTPIHVLYFSNHNSNSQWSTIDHHHAPYHLRRHHWCCIWCICVFAYYHWSVPL